MTFSNVASLLALKICTAGTVPLVVSERNMQSLQVTNIRRRDRFMTWSARRLYRYATGVLAISHPVAGELVAASGVPARRVFVVPNPVIRSPERPAPEVPLISKQLHLVLVGRQAKQKRPQLFLAVLDELVRRGFDVRGTVIGDGPLRGSTELEANRIGLDVSFIGWREPWWEAVSDVDCLLLTANAEGFANVLIEAAAAGIPSVASSRALGVADAILPGVTGELAMEDSPEAYANAVLSAAALGMTPDINIHGWLNRFSTGQSTAMLLAAFCAVIRSDSK
jgi:glycosyltransferase involved in cell wall biosynthesis